MALFCRLAAGKRIFNNQLFKNENSAIFKLMRPVTIQSTQAVPKIEEGHDERNLRLGRPQSPHLTIYKPQLTSMLSITHRMTGMVLASYAIGLSAAAVYGSCPIDVYIEQLRCMALPTSCIVGIKFTLAAPLCYHFFSGLRHLFWDSGRFLTIKEVYTTGYIMLAFAATSAVILSVC